MLIWCKIGEWCNIPPIFAFTFKDLLIIHKNSSTSRAKQKAIYAVILITCWVIWRSRNALIFSGKRVDPDRLLGEIKSTAYLWIKHRAKNLKVEWEQWCTFKF
ncbi:hypothetical protein Hanom_Chr04g00296321 [Helianthus anomalus]